jgi:hypothetical protein
MLKVWWIQLRLNYVFEESATYYLAKNKKYSRYKGFALLAVHFFLLHPNRN